MAAPAYHAHRQSALGLRGHLLHRPGPGLRCEREAIAGKKDRERDRSLLHGEGRTDAHARARAERQILEAVYLSAVFRIEARWPVGLGIIPQLAVAMHRPGHHEHLRALRDVEVLVRVVLDGF